LSILKAIYVSDEFETDANKKVKSQKVSEAKLKEKEDLRVKREKELEAKQKAQEAREKAKQEEVVKASTELSGPKTVGKIDLDTKKKSEETPDAPKEAIVEDVKAEVEKTVKESVAKADVPKAEKASKPEETPEAEIKETTKEGLKKVVVDGELVTPDEKVQTQYKKLTGPKIAGDKIDLSQFNKPKKKKEDKPGAKAGDANKKNAKNRREKRDKHREQTEIDQQIEAAESKIIKVTEFVTASEMATMMDVGVTQIISACMSLGMMVTMNQRLDAETLSIEESIEEVEDQPEDLELRAPIVTVMGHVDHGKTSLLDYIRKENVIAGESGGITQHIGAYGVQLEGGQKIAFLDTPGHEAFTAMRARGAQVTDIAIIVAAADDDIMPQTKEAISHAQAAGVPIVFAINKIDKPDANPEKIKDGLAQMNLLVEDWGGKVQSHDISAKVGTGVKELLEKVLLEAELLELKANPNKAAIGTVVEAFLDKGRGYVSTILVQAGTLKVGDYVLAGQHSGKVKAMHDERGNDVAEAGPSTPVSILGLDGAPQAGDKFNVFADEREAKQIASKRAQLQREQSVRTQRHITLDEIGRRIALGDFQELNIILKGDVDGSVEALTDSFQKLSTEEIQVNIMRVKSLIKKKSILDHTLLSTMLLMILRMLWKACCLQS